jgi:hypothetical protein
MSRIVARLTAAAYVVCLTLASSIALSRDNTTWDAGLAAFGIGEFSTALAQFEMALAEGQSGPAVHYNIGVCQFQMGQYDAAETTFGRISHEYPKMRGLAEYNLGLVAFERDQWRAAQRHFLAAYHLSPEDEDLRILASTMLRRTESNFGSPSSWTGTVGANAGYDDNIVLRDEIGVPANLATDSSLMDLFGSVRGPVGASSRLYVDANAYLISYFDNNDFDQSEVTVGVSYYWQQNDWRSRLGANIGYSTFGGDAFDNSRNIDARLTRNLSPASSLRFRYQYTDINAADSINSGIDGSQQRMEIRYRWYQESRRFDATYLFETNDRSDPGISATRNRLRLSYQYSLNSAWTANLGGDFRASRYSDLMQPRTEDLVSLKAGVSRSFRSGWRLLAQYQHASNSSTDDTFSYTRNQISIGMLKIF